VGLTGLLGAALGAATGRRVPRVALALFCGAMGLLFGAIMDFSTLATFSGEHTLEQYIAISATALPFNIATRSQHRLLPGLRAGPRPLARAFPRAPAHHLDPAEVTRS